MGSETGCGDTSLELEIILSYGVISASVCETLSQKEPI